MGYVIGAIACVLYSAFLYYVAIRRPPGIIKMVKLKFGKKMSDNTAAIICYVFASIVLAGGIVLFTHPWS
jgi:hypothetical protein